MAADSLKLTKPRTPSVTKALGMFQVWGLSRSCSAVTSGSITISLKAEVLKSLSATLSAMDERVQFQGRGSLVLPLALGKNEVLKQAAAF